MKGSERKGVAHAVGAAVVEVGEVVESVQHSLSKRTFRALGLSGSVAESAQRAHTTGVHLSIRGIAKASSFLTGHALEHAAPTSAPSLADSRKGATAIAAMSCAFGDNMKTSGNALTPHMSVRVDGKRVELTPEDLATVWPQASSHVVVFVHGLGGTEFAWNQPQSYGDLLSHEFDLSPVFVRYNTGAKISDNGDELCELLTELVTNWPADIQTLDVVGHSMGGLVLRSACNVGQAGDSPWIPLLTNAIYLGTPHHGAPMEQVAHAAIGLLGQSEHTAPIARLANRRSAGIKDLRQGAVAATDESASAEPKSISPDPPLLASANHVFVASQLLPDKWGPLTSAVGDLMVQVVSATGSHPDRGLQAPPNRSQHRLQGVTHIGLLCDADVYEILRLTLPY